MPEEKLTVAMKELAEAHFSLVFQNEEKEKRAGELLIANTELIFQNEEKEKRAAELLVANAELHFQNKEKEKREYELLHANKELESFTFISSHDLQEPLRKIQIFITRILDEEVNNLSPKGADYFLRIQDAADRMQTLIADLLAYSRTTSSERKFETANLQPIIESVIEDFAEIITATNATVELGSMCEARIIPFQFRQLIYNLVGNSIKFAIPGKPLLLKINCSKKFGPVENHPLNGYTHISVSDNGIGFDSRFKDYIFEIFKRLRDTENISGTGIGLTIVKKIVENHNGIIIANGELNKGATFDIYLP